MENGNLVLNKETSSSELYSARKEMNGKTKDLSAYHSTERSLDESALIHEQMGRATMTRSHATSASEQRMAPGREAPRSENRSVTHTVRSAELAKFTLKRHAKLVALQVLATELVKRFHVRAEEVGPRKVRNGAAGAERDPARAKRRT